MAIVSRRAALASAGAAFVLPRPAVAQTDQRPSVTVAVQKIANTNTLETLREQSNVGTRHAGLYGEALIEQDWLGDLQLKPGLATAWRRVDDRTLEFDLRPGVRFHDGREMTAEDVVLLLRPEAHVGARHDPPGRAGNLFGSVPGTDQNKEPHARRPPPSRRRTFRLRADSCGLPRPVRFVNRVPDPTLEGACPRPPAWSVRSSSSKAPNTWLDLGARCRSARPLPGGRRDPPDRPVLVAHDGMARPPAAAAGFRFVEGPEVAGRINMLLSTRPDFACDIRPDQIGGSNAPPATRCWAARS
jgi:peptide/nickel transport system substrate-binding protein